MLDKLGKEIFVGSFIAYGHNLDRSAGIRVGKVLKIEETTYIGRPLIKIFVRGINDDWNHHTPKLTKHNGVLNYPSRIIVIGKYDLPEEYRKLLETV